MPITTKEQKDAISRSMYEILKTRLAKETFKDEVIIEICDAVKAEAQSWIDDRQDEMKQDAAFNEHEQLSQED